MLHGDECTHVKGHYFVERMQINMIFAAVLHILYLLNLLLLLLLLLLSLLLWAGGGDSFTA